MSTPDLDRRSFLIGAAGAAGLIVGAAPTASAAAPNATRVYVLAGAAEETAQNAAAAVRSPGRDPYAGR